MQFKNVLLLAALALTCMLALVQAIPKNHEKHHNPNSQRPKRSYGHYYGDDGGYDVTRQRYGYGDDVDFMTRQRYGYGDDVDMAAQQYGYNRYGYGDDDVEKQVAAAEMERQKRPPRQG